jgi:aldose 1-epimerase
MRLIKLTDPETGSTATIAPDLGFNCFRFRVRLRDNRTINVLSAVDGFELGGQRPSHSGIPLLFPYPNRIAGGRYHWDGREYQLPEGLVPWDRTGNAIHGFCIDRPWRVTDEGTSSVTGVFRLSLDAPDRLPYWPADAEIQVQYQLLGGCLRADIRVHNPSDRPLPFGFGTHPYFAVPLAPGSSCGQCRVKAPTDHAWKLNDCLPDANGGPVKAAIPLAASPALCGLKLDDVYTDLHCQGHQIVCRIEDPAAHAVVEQRFAPDFRELVAFTPTWSSAVCLEPYTCMTNAINLQATGINAGLRVLAPGEAWQSWIEIEARSTTA